MTDSPYSNTENEASLKSWKNRFQINQRNGLVTDENQSTIFSFFITISKKAKEKLKIQF